MNDQKLDKKVRQDAEKVKKDLGVLLKDTTARFNSFESSVSMVSGKAKKDLTKQVEGTVSDVSKGLVELTENAAKTVVGTALTMNKDITHWLSHFNSKAQKAVEKVPEKVGKKASKYPWAVISIGLAVGFLLGLIFLPTRQPIEQVQI